MGGSLNISELRGAMSTQPEYGGIDCFVETGTFQGKTIFHMAAHFRTLHTIELSEELHAKAAAHAERFPNVAFHQGDSSFALLMLCEQIQESAIFYLDAHYCGSGQGVDGHFPLFDELRAIASRQLADVIVIDDLAAFGKVLPRQGLDWSAVTEQSVLACFKPGQVKRSFPRNDRYYIFLLEGGL